MTEQYYEFECIGPAKTKFYYYLQYPIELTEWEEGSFLSFIEDTGLEIMFRSKGMIWIPEEWMVLLYDKNDIRISKLND